MPFTSPPLETLRDYVLPAEVTTDDTIEIWNVSTGNPARTSLGDLLALVSSTSSTSTGGNGAADAGKLLKFDANGSVYLGGALVNSGSTPVFKVIVGTGFGIQSTVVSTGGFGYEAGLLADNTVGYSSHLVFDGQTGVALDGNGGTNSTAFQCNVSGVILKGQDSDANDVCLINSDGTIQVFTGANYVSLAKATTLTANRTQKLVDAAGVLPVVPEYVDLTAANGALAAGDFWWDTTLKKLRTATA